MRTYARPSNPSRDDFEVVDLRTAVDEYMVDLVRRVNDRRAAAGEPLYVPLEQRATADTTGGRQ